LKSRDWQIFYKYFAALPLVLGFNGFTFLKGDTFFWDNVSLAKKARCSALAIFVEIPEPNYPKGTSHRNISKKNIPVRCTLKLPGLAKDSTNISRLCRWCRAV